MRVYLQFASKAFRQRFAYRANTWLNMLTAILGLFVQLSIWKALYHNRNVVNGISLLDMMTFVIVGMAVSALTYSRVGNTLANKVVDGSIAGDFIRPVSLKYYLMAEEFGGNCYTMVFSFLPVSIAAMLFVPFRGPQSAAAMVLFLVSLALGILLMHYIHYTLGLLAFWFKRSIYVNWFLGAFFTLFGGQQVPLWFFPEPLHNIAMILPVRFVSFEPLSIYLGQRDISEGLYVLGLQAIWILMFWLLERVIWAKAQRVITVQGG